MVDEARSSSASHYSKGFSSATAGIAENQLFGIQLSNDLSTAPPFELVGLAVIIFLLIIKPYIRILSRRDVSIAFWVGIISAIYFLRDVTLTPLLTTIVYTRTSYPYLVVIPHCVASAAAYRSLRNNDNLHYLTSFGIAFFCYGFGGSIVSDVLMGLPATALGHPRIVPSYVLGWLLVWFSPGDIVYTLLQNQQSPVRWFLVACEAVDGVTTPMGRISRSARELSNKGTAPLMAGLLAGAGGAALRYGERVVLQGETGEHPAVSRALEMAVWRTLGYSVLWWWLVVYRCENGHTELSGTTNHCAQYNGSDLLRVAIVMAHVIWTMLCEAGLAHGHPFVWVSQTLRETIGGPQIVSMFQLGPQAMRATKEKTEKKD